MRYVESVLDLVGDTHLIKISSLLSRGSATVLAKAEHLNPGGSVKDRIGAAMIDDAERRGRLRPGGTIVEATSGNTGVGLAIAAQRKGYSCIFVCPDKVSSDKINVLRAYGAEVVVCPTAVAPDDERSYYRVTDTLAAQIDGAWKPDQYANPVNPRTHYCKTGPEIWRDTDGAITHFVAGIGTGGTISGVGRYLKEISEGRVCVIGADPDGSVYSGGSGRPYLVEGVGEDIWPATYDRDICDSVEPVSDSDAFAMTRRLAREEGLLVGGSGGMAVVIAAKVAERIGPGGLVVVLLPDSGRGYLSKIFDDQWSSENGFLATESLGLRVSDVLPSKRSDLPALLHVEPTQTVAAAVGLLRQYGISQAPVLNCTPPACVAEIVGAVIEEDLLEALSSGRAQPHETVAQHLSGRLPTIGSGELLQLAFARLADNNAAVVVEGGRSLGILTRQDLLGFLTDKTLAGVAGPPMSKLEAPA